MIEMEPRVWCYECHEPILEPSDVWVWNAYIYHEKCLPPTETEAETLAATYGSR